MTADRKPPREVRAWAGALKGRIDYWTVRPTRHALQNTIGQEYAGGWSNAKRRGWRAVPVRIVPEVADGG